MSLVLCLVPVLLVTYGFIHVNLPTRIFDYFAFYGLMTLTISKKYSTAVYTLLLILLLLTGLYTIKDKKVFFYTAPGERAAAQDISKQNIFSGTIFSDQVFANHLILQDFYKVTGAGDKDALVQNLFYQKDKDKFLEAIRILYNAKIEYIAITNRMRERYILMVNFPQTHMTNSELYSELESVYNNGEVTVYKTKK